MNKWFWIAATFVALAIFTSFASPASAGVFFVSVSEFGAGPCTVAPGGDTITSNAPVSTFEVCGPVSGTASNSAVSDFGHVGAQLTKSTCCGSPGDASATYTTLVTFSSIANPNSSGSIDVALNLDVAGILGVAGSANTAWDATADIGSSDFSYGTSIDTGAAPLITQNGMDFISGGQQFPNTNSDIIAGILRTDVVSVPLNAPVFIQIGISLGGFANPGSLSNDFLNSVDFPIGSDVFKLPDGFTANAPEDFLINNRFLTPVSGVPEPLTLTIFGAGLAGIAALRSRRRKTA